MNLNALTTRHAPPSLIHDLLLGIFDSVPVFEIRPGMFGLVCITDDRVRLVIAYQWKEPDGWTYTISTGKIFREIESDWL